MDFGWILVLWEVILDGFGGSDLLFTVMAYLALSSTLWADPRSYDMIRRRNNKSVHEQKTVWKYPTACVEHARARVTAGWG